MAAPASRASWAASFTAHPQLNAAPTSTPRLKFGYAKEPHVKGLAMTESSARSADLDTYQAERPSNGEAPRVPGSRWARIKTNGATVCGPV